MPLGEQHRRRGQLLGLSEVDLLHERAGRGKRVLIRRAQRIGVLAQGVYRPRQIQDLRAGMNFPEEALARVCRRLSGRGGGEGKGRDNNSDRGQACCPFPGRGHKRSIGANRSGQWCGIVQVNLPGRVCR